MSKHTHEYPMDAVSVTGSSDQATTKVSDSSWVKAMDGLPFLSPSKLNLPDLPSAPPIANHGITQVHTGLLSNAHTHPIVGQTHIYHATPPPITGIQMGETYLTVRDYSGREVMTFHFEEGTVDFHESIDVSIAATLFWQYAAQSNHRIANQYKHMRLQEEHEAVKEELTKTKQLLNKALNELGKKYNEVLNDEEENEDAE